LKFLSQSPSRGISDIVKKYPTVSLSLTLEPDKIQDFFPLLQGGIMVKVQVGCSIKTILCKQFGLSPEYVEDRVKTILLDGKTVDDIDSAIIRDGSILALSAAMPGLAGAILRRGGDLALLRSQTTYREEKEYTLRREGVVVLKLFNLLVNELGPGFLKEGVLVKPEDLDAFLMSLPEEFWEGCKVAAVDDQEVGLDYLLGLEWLENHDLVMLRVEGDV